MYNSLMNSTELSAFIADAVSFIGPLVTELRDYECGCDANGTAWVNAKTYRTASGYNDCDGTAYPSESADAAAKALGNKYGFYEVRWEPCEKGWGSYYFFTKQNIIKQKESSLEYARKNWREYSAKLKTAKGEEAVKLRKWLGDVETHGKKLKAELEALKNS